MEKDNQWGNRLTQVHLEKAVKTECVSVSDWQILDYLDLRHMFV